MKAGEWDRLIESATNAPYYRKELLIVALLDSMAGDPDAWTRIGEHLSTHAQAHVLCWAEIQLALEDNETADYEGD